MYRGRFGVIAGLRRLMAGARPAAQGPAWRDLKGAYVRMVEGLKADMPHDRAMEMAIGDGFEETGRIEAALVRHYGLGAQDYLIDVGCGSGRLARPLSAYLAGRYLGTDLVPDLLAHAKRIVGRPDWRFEEVDHIAIPEADGQADMVCFFSVLTHLLHEQSFLYLQEARRVLKPGGRIVLSTLEYGEPAHWRTFEATAEAGKAGVDMPLNVFLGREVLPIWAEHLGLVVEDQRGAGEVIVPEGHLGQAICVLRKPA